MVTAQINRELESAEDVVIDCFYNADSRTSQVRPSLYLYSKLTTRKLNKDDEYAHLLKLRSQQPFSLIKSVSIYKSTISLSTYPATRSFLGVASTKGMWP